MKWRCKRNSYTTYGSEHSFFLLQCVSIDEEEFHFRGSVGYGFAGVKVGADPAGGDRQGRSGIAYTPRERRAVLPPRAYPGGIDNSILYLLLPDIRKHVGT